uniref:Uncharacterized protein n=1 Tax=viral metagenome TaxID=1070528 RepID=A0A6M3KFP7_9ZZZZ
MKKNWKSYWFTGFLFAVMMFVCVAASQNIAPDWPGSQTTGLKSGTLGAANTVQILPLNQNTGWLTGVQIQTNGTDAATLTIHSGVTTAAPVVFKRTVVGNTYYADKTFPVPVKLDGAIYTILSGTTPVATFILEYMD